MNILHPRKGKFIVFDGPSASGKNTIIKQLLLELDNLQISYFYFEEVTSEGYDKEAILQAKKKGEHYGTYGDREVVEAFVKERQKLYFNYVLPKLSTQTYVIANRGEPSTLAYQTIHNESTMQEVWDLHRDNNITLADLVVITNCSVKEAIARESQRGTITSTQRELQGKFTTVSNHLPENAVKKIEKIHTQYKEVKKFLEKEGVPVLDLDTDLLSISGEVRKILERLREIDAG